MIMEQMANYLIGSILFAFGSIVLVFGVLLINNLLHRYWKPITIVFFRNESVYPSVRFTNLDDTKIKEPHLESPELDKPKH